MRSTQIAAQLYTVRATCQDAAGLAATLARIHAIGYRAVQISGVGPIPAVDIRRICDAAGVVICATHESGASICDQPQQVIERLRTLGCTVTAYPFPHLPIRTLDEVRALAARLDHAGAILRAAGMTLCYHNHDLEFVRIGGKTVLDWLYDLTDPAHLAGEPDVYWVQKGGGDPVRWCERLSGRLPLIHLKEFACRFGADGGLHSGVIAEVGSGNLDWPRILHTAEVSGCRWFIVEQDTCDGDPVQSLARSWDYLQHFVQP